MEFGGMVHGGRTCSSETAPSEEDLDLRRGPWTVEEDLILINYISTHGEGRWNSLARCAGLRRTGKSCRLRWLNYLRPDVRRGNITPEEQLLILELHSHWGNRWSKIAQHLPGRTDNEIKNYWRTRVQKHAKRLKCDVNSKQFKDVMRYLWMPHLLERIRAANSGSSSMNQNLATPLGGNQTIDTGSELGQPKLSENSNAAAGSSSDSIGTQRAPIIEDKSVEINELRQVALSQATTQCNGYWYDMDTLQSPGCYGNQGLLDFEQAGLWNGDLGEDLWNLEDSWLQQ